MCGICLVCEHGALYAVPYGVNVGQDGLEAAVDRNPAPVVPLNAELLQPQAGGVGPPSHAHKQHVRLHLLLLTILQMRCGTVTLQLLLFTHL